MLQNFRQIIKNVTLFHPKLRCPEDPQGTTICQTFGVAPHPWVGHPLWASRPWRAGELSEEHPFIHRHPFPFLRIMFVCHFHFHLFLIGCVHTTKNVYCHCSLVHTAKNIYCLCSLDTSFTKGGHCMTFLSVSRSRKINLTHLQSIMLFSSVGPELELVLKHLYFHENQRYLTPNRIVNFITAIFMSISIIFVLMHLNSGPLC